MNETILTILFVAAVTAFFSYKAYKQKQASWKGELIEKYKKDGDDDTGVVVVVGLAQRFNTFRVTDVFGTSLCPLSSSFFSSSSTL